MEGLLEIWEGGIPWGKWKRRHFILNDFVLTYCKQVESEVLGRIHMKVASLDAIDENPVEFKIYSGISELKLKADTAELKTRWIKALQNAQTGIFNEEESVKAIKRVLAKAGDSKAADEQMKFLLTDAGSEEIDREVAQIFERQAIFASQLSLLKTSANESQRKTIEDLQATSAGLKKNFSQCMKIIQEQKDKLLVIQEVFRRKVNPHHARSREYSAEQGKILQTALKEILEEKSAARGTDVVFVEKEDRQPDDDSKFYSIFEDREEMERVKSSYFVPPELALQNEKRKSFARLSMAESLTILKADTPHPFISLLLEENSVFKQNPVLPEDPEVRKIMPVSRSETKINVWALLKDNIGKDLSRITMPIYLNDPISMLQKAAEILEFTEYLRKADACEDEYLRLAYILCFQYALFIYSVNRLKKPFNPLLGETYEYVRDDIRFVSEQVSHHPPVSAFYCESDNFIFEGSLNCKSSISLSGFEVTPKGPFKIFLKRTKEWYSFIRCKTTLHNFIVGKMYLWHGGEAIVINETTKSKAILFLKPKGWTAKHDYECEGKIVDSEGKSYYTLYGKWNNFLTALRLSDKSEIELIEKKPLPPDAENQYNFSEFIRNINNLSLSMLSLLPPTDSRFRPDQRGYEYGMIEEATAEKNRLEEKQRKRKKENEGSGHEWNPLWFNLQLDEKNEMLISYKGGYFEAREQRKWPEDVLDLYNL